MTISMSSIGQKLNAIYARNVLSSDTETSKRSSYGHSVDTGTMLSSMSAMVPDGEGTKWQLTNIGGIGSDDDKTIREEAAKSESAFEGAGQCEGLEIWRVEKFTPQKLDAHEIRANNLNLYSGDCYIILKTTKKDESSEQLDWQLHYWIGKDSTADEYGAAAHFTVNIDDLLNQKPVQHREVQYSESALFHSYFGSVTYLDGGIDSGFRKAEPEVYTPRLLQMKSINDTVRVMQVGLAATSLNDGDVFILDAGLQIYQFNGSSASVGERRRAMEIVHEDIIAERSMEPTLEIIDGDDILTHPQVCELFGCTSIDAIAPAVPDDDSENNNTDAGNASDEADLSAPKSLYKISNETGELIMSKEKSDVDCLSPDDINDDDAWAVACDGQCFLHVGTATSHDERFYVWNRCPAIIAALDLPPDAPVTFFSKDSDASIWSQLFA